MLIYDLNANPLNPNEWAFPLRVSFHVTSSAAFHRYADRQDLRLLGLAFKRQTAGQLVKDTGLWTRRSDRRDHLRPVGSFHRPDPLHQQLRVM